jgi:prophage tail gpP-like protein
MKGRDLMARLHDTDITGERSFNNATYEELFKAALEDVGLNHDVIEISNTANRKVRAGANVKVGEEPVKVSEVKTSPTALGFKNIVIAKLGETWLQFLERQFQKIGLFPWCDANGNFVLSRPNGQQKPLYHFYRKRFSGESPAEDDANAYGGKVVASANVESFEYTNDTTKRFSEVVIFARNGGRKKGHNHTNGKFEDLEMKALGFNRRRVHRDVDVTNADEATFYARMKIAEVNRASVKLVYVISGHSAPTIDDPKKRAIIVPDTVAHIDDFELGIHDNWYIETVEYRSPPRTTVVTMMRIQDLLFGEEQAAYAAKKAAEAPPKKKDRESIAFTRDTPAQQRVHQWAGQGVEPPKGSGFG